MEIVLDKRAMKQIRVSGGGSRSQLWRQIQADVFGQQAATINAEEGPAYGIVEGSDIAIVNAPPYERHERTGKKIGLGKAKLLPPVAPKAVVLPLSAT